MVRLTTDVLEARLAEIEARYEFLAGEKGTVGDAYIAEHAILHEDAPWLIARVRSLREALGLIVALYEDPTLDGAEESMAGVARSALAGRPHTALTRAALTRAEAEAVTTPTARG